MSQDFADLFNPAAAPRSYVPPGALPPVIDSSVPQAWRDAAERALRDSHPAAESVDYTPDASPLTDGEEWDVPDEADAAAGATARERRQARRLATRQRRDRKRETKAEGKYRLRSKLMKPKMTGTVGYITYSTSEQIAWFYQPPVAWNMKDIGWQRQRIDKDALVLARLAEAGVTDLHRRVVRAPWPVAQWAKRHDAWAAQSWGGRLPDVPDALTWDDYLAGQQAALLYTHPTIKLRFWGIYLPKRGRLAQWVETVAGWVGDSDGAWGWRQTVRSYADRVAAQEVAEHRDFLDTVTRIMGAGGVRATPVQPGLLDYLLTKSSTLGLPMEATPAEARDVPRHGEGDVDWSVTDLAALAEAADAVVVPGDDYVQVTGTINGVRTTGYVIVVTIGRMGVLPIPEQMLPWQVLGDVVDPTVEWSERLTLIGRNQAAKDMRKQSDQIVAQWNHFTKEHDEDPPEALREQYARTKQIRNDLDHDQTGFTTRVKGVFRFAVTGSSPDEVRHKVALLREKYEPRIELHQEHGQFQLLREFLPCEKQANTAHTRRMPVRTLAAGMAAVGDHLGDREGIVLGETASIARRPVCWNPFRAMEMLNRSGFTPVVAVPGGGKSFLCALIVYMCVRGGSHGVILDPSGPLKALRSLPELRPFTQVYELTGARTVPGSLNPYRVIADPDPNDDDYDPRNPAYALDDDPAAAARNQYDADVKAAHAERKSTAVTVLRMMLPKQVREMTWTSAVLNRAASDVGGEDTHSLREVITAIRAIGDTTDEDHQLRATASLVASELDLMTDLREARVLFDTRDTTGETTPGPAISAGRGDVRLTILTMPGIALPSKTSDESTWSPAERMAAPLMHLAAWQANRLIYDMPRNARKVLFLDENKYLKEIGTGRTLNMRVERDSRKYNVRALVASQLADDFLGSDAVGDDDQSALTHEVIVGSVGNNAKAIASTLKLLGLPAGQGYEASVENLSIDTGDQSDNDDDIDAGQAALESARRRPDDQASRFIIRSGSDIENVICDFSNSVHLAHVFAALKSDPTAVAANWRKDVSS